MAGMTGTAATEAEEFYKIYKLDVVVIPTNENIARKDHNDVVYKTESAKFFKLKSEFKNIKSQLEKEKQKADKLDEDLTNELRQKHIWWFLCGAGVLLLGFMIGFT